MHPVLFEIFGTRVYSYGTFFVLALVIFFGTVLYEARRRRWKHEEMVPILLAGFVGGMIGARTSIYFFNGPETAPQTLSFLSLFDPRIGPGSILGAVGGGYLGGYIANRAIGRRQCACDAFAPAMAISLAVGRIGNFLGGTDGLGKPTTLPWGVQLPSDGYLVHPTPLYDAAFDATWFLVLWSIRDHPRLQNGNLLKLGLAGYALARFLIEFTRNNRVLAYGLTGQQFFCLGLLLLLAAYVAWARRPQVAADA